MPNCSKCNDTGVWETGNNDLPCSCPAGATARFNVCTSDGLKEMTGAEVREHARPVPQPMTQFMLIYTTEGKGDVYMWWRSLGAGYTRYVEEAGRFTIGEALDAWRGAPDKVGAVPLDVVMENASKVLQVGALHEKLEAGVHGLPRGWKREAP